MREIKIMLGETAAETKLFIDGVEQSGVQGIDFRLMGVLVLREEGEAEPGLRPIHTIPFGIRLSGKAPAAIVLDPRASYDRIDGELVPWPQEEVQ